MMLGDNDNTQRNKNLEVRRMSSGIKAVSRLYVNVTNDAEYVCRWSTRAGPADNLTCIVSSITGNHSSTVLFCTIQYVE